VNNAASHDSTFVFDAWRINARITSLLVGALPHEIWHLALPGSPRRTVGALAAHLHNIRCLWLKELGAVSRVKEPARVAPRTVAQDIVLEALSRSDEAIEALLRAGIEAGGRFPGRGGAFVYGAIPREAALFVTYAIAHESHHRGQLVVAARQLAHPLPQEVVAGLWQWSSRLKESR
jgi:uncharacterized damage-inducible protein DinB